MSGAHVAVQERRGTNWKHVQLSETDAPASGCYQRARSGVYPTDAGLLFVPTEDMWAVHEAGKPAAVAERAGLQPGTWHSWKIKFGRVHPWLFDWLYSWHDDPPAEAADFKPTWGMLAFRKEATIQAVANAAKRPAVTVAAARAKRLAGRRKYQDHVTVQLIASWRQHYGQYKEWLDPWLLRGAELPRHVHAVTADQAGRCRRAWNHIAHCETAGIISEATYVKWIKERLIPDLAWLKWLFGYHAPAGAFVVDESLSTLRAKMSVRGVLDAAGLNGMTVADWKKHSAKNQALQEAIAAQSVPGRKQDDPPVWSEAAAALHPKVRRSICRYAAAQTLAACCKRAGMDVTTFKEKRRKAEELGVAEQLRQYLAIEGNYGPETSKQCGLVAPNFFIASPAMLAFRAAASKAASAGCVWQRTLTELPGFWDWFEDWTRPRWQQDRVYKLPRNTPVSVPPQHDQTSGNGARPNGRHHTEDHQSQPPTEAQPATSGMAETGEANEYTGHRKKPYQTGRRPDPATEAVYKFCYEGYVAGRPRTAIMEAAKREFRDGDPPQRESDITIYAKRWARRFEPALPLNRKQPTN
jgi:hypothetical protein